MTTNPCVPVGVGVNVGVTVGVMVSVRVGVIVIVGIRVVEGVVVGKTAAAANVFPVLVALLLKKASDVR
jgi:hypothetical protein